MSPVELLVCTKCRRAAGSAADAGMPDGGGAGPVTPEAAISDPENPDAERPGTLLYRQLAGLETEGIRVTPVECLSNCDHGCTIALRGPGRWSYVYGRLDPATDVGVILDGAGKYRAAADGIVVWRERPVHFRKNCIARIPPSETP
jgi:predicted metal-binding protein